MEELQLEQLQQIIITITNEIYECLFNKETKFRIDLKRQNFSNLLVLARKNCYDFEIIKCYWALRRQLTMFLIVIQVEKAHFYNFTTLKKSKKKVLSD